jgi:hypothetical protein
VRRALATRWVVAAAAALAFALTLPSIGNGFGIDDHLYRARIVDDGWTASRAARDLFVFADPDRAEARTAALASGELSWWAAPRLRWGFLRPIPAVIHHAEWTVFGRGGAPWMHLHSVLWMAALAALVALLYRRISGPTWIAGLAAVLYAVDDGHGFAAGWLSNRCAIIGSCFAVLALLAHDRWRRDRRRAGAVLGPLALAVALACSEQMVAACGFLAAYALVLDGAPWPRRAATLAPYAVLAALWFAARASLGYGSDGTGSYTDPFGQPLAFAAQAAERAPILAHSLLGALPADLWEVFFVRRGLTWLMVLLGLAFLAVLARCFVPLLRTDRVARFWALGGGLALLVVCGAHPNDRHLLLVSIAGSALVARFLASFVRSPDTVPAAHRRGARALAVALFAIHAVLAPILLPIRARIPGSVSRGVGRIDALLPGDPALAGQDLVLVSVPFKYLCNFASVVRRANGGVSPRRWRCLGVTPDDVLASRPDERTLVLRPANGYLRHFEDTNVRARSVPFAAGDRVELPDFTIAIRAITPDARPLEIELRFAVPLEDPSLRWLVWRDGAYRPFAPPAVGQALTIPAERFAFGDLLADR